MIATTRKIVTGLVLAAAVGGGVAVSGPAASAGTGFGTNAVFVGSGASPESYFDAEAIAERTAWRMAEAAHGQSCAEDPEPILSGHFHVTVTVRCA